MSVIIVSWNVRELLVQCLNALHTSEVRGSLRLEIIVVDNASSDGSAEAASAFGTVRVIEAGENLGYGSANNVGFKHARGKHFLVLNPDTVPQPGSLEALYDFMSSRPRSGIVSPRLLNPDGTVQEAAFRFPTVVMAALDIFPLPRILPGRVRLLITGSRLNGRYPIEARTQRPFRIDHPLGACMLINRQAYEDAGGFDPGLHMYSEEIDLALRYAQAGWECWQVPSAKVLHLGGQSTRQMPDRMYVELWRSRLYIYSKHYGKIPRVALGLLLAMGQLRDVLAALIDYRRQAIARGEARQRWRRAGTLLRLALKQ